ncbi:hypothetical protein CU098_008985, partial [Rhizopus stolonifer]
VYLIKRLEKQNSLQKSDPKSIQMDTMVTPLLSKLTATEPIWEKLIRNANSIETRVELFTRLQQDNIPDNVRGIVWQAICQTSSSSHAVILYEQLKQDVSPFHAMIEHDVQDMPHKEAIMRILDAYSLYDARVGYYPGMASLVSPVLAQMSENEAFGMFVRLMELYDMRSLYMYNMEGLQLCLHQFQTVLSHTLPKLDAHLSQLAIQPSMYASQWYLTLFTTCISTQQHIMRMYDLTLLEGVNETVSRLAILLLQKNEARLLSMSEPDQVLQCLTSTDLHAYAYPHTHDFVQDIIAMNPVLLKMDLDQKEKKNLTALSKRMIMSAQTTVPKLQQQIEDLVTAMSQLQKEHAALAQNNMTLRMREMDQEAAQSKLAKRNAVLEKRVKKYKVKLANASTTSESDDTHAVPALPPTTEKTPEKRQDQYHSFVASLRDTGDFGALIAGALTVPPAEEPKTAQLTQTQLLEELQQQADRKKLDTALQNVTSELVAIKLDHFETKQRYETLYHHCEQLTAQIQSMQESQNALVQKIIYLESELDDVQAERDQILQDQEEVLEVAMVAKKTAAELQLEKLALAKDIERLEQTIKDLEEEKKAFFMPRGTFTEEVFAAHSILFGENKSSAKEQNRRHTLQLGLKNEDEYKTKFVESELRCRELEKYLAETKVKLAELESGSTMSPRGSMQQQRRASVYNKRSSAASLSMLANRMSTPTSPRERRGSTESYASSVTSLTSMNSSNYNSKRSSVYSRIWNTFGSPTTPVNPVASVNIKNDIMCEEPQIIQQQTTL